MRVRRMVRKGVKLEYRGRPTPCVVYTWPAEREIPEGFEELEIVSPAPKQGDSCFWCGGEEALTIGSLKHPEETLCSRCHQWSNWTKISDVTDPGTDCDHRAGMHQYKARFCQDCGVELQPIQAASGDETLASRPEAGEG